MEYICHRRFKGIGMNGKPMNIPYGSKFNVMPNGIIETPDHKAICYNTSYAADHHFAINDDDRGLERGKYTYAIAFKPRQNKDGTGVRWSKDEAKLIEKEWSKFLREDVDVLLFNNDFFHAEIEELKRMAESLNIDIPKK